jgi:zona occludens toxin (predicted ATPase)
MPVEVYLTRQLNIRFIDARTLCIEAKLSLGVDGYYAQNKEQMLIDEAIRIYGKRPNEEQQAMRRLKTDLDAIKIPTGSLSTRRVCHVVDECDTEASNSSAESSAARSSSINKRRKFKIWSLRGY